MQEPNCRRGYLPLRASDPMHGFGDYGTAQEITGQDAHHGDGCYYYGVTRSDGDGNGAPWGFDEAEYVELSELEILCLLST